MNNENIINPIIFHSLGIYIYIYIYIRGDVYVFINVRV